MSLTNDEYEQYVNFIEDVLYTTTAISDYITVLESLDIQYKHGRFKGGCHNDIDELSSAGYHVQFDEAERKFYCQVCKVGYNLLTFVEQIFKARGENKTRNECLKYICNTLDIPFNFTSNESKPKSEYNWRKSLLKYLPKQDKVEELTVYNEGVMDVFPKIYHQSWIDYGISIETLEKYNIRYYLFRQQIIIPCYDKDNILRGVRVRNMIEDSISKYNVLQTLNSNQYGFPTGQIFYGENHNFEEIRRTKTVWLVESEKSVLKFDTWFGDRNVSLGLFGSNMTKSKLLRLLQLEVTTAYIMIDSDFNEMHDKDFEKFEEKVYKMYDMMKNYIPNIYVVYNNQGWKNCYKYSTADYTREQFDILMREKERIE